ncbi:uncharacterized protein LOC124355943 [Homalodisca vitripennis]|uniref:uncharacterized protein LOC124355943 n=1 Tax=Homalodisca vitripennis TaxID=197043 RepID=UPI001EEB7F6D|nr:uncharacterized protein LOC124355943 [Homalodisca vitripennis]
MESQVLKITKKANATLGFIIRVSRDGFSPWALRKLYVHLMRPLLEYCSPVWSPYSSGLISLIESVQVRFLRLIGLRPGYAYWEVPIEELRQQLLLPTLRSRRLVADIVFLRGVLTAEIDSTELLSRVILRCSRPVTLEGLVREVASLDAVRLQQYTAKITPFGEQSPTWFGCF